MLDTYKTLQANGAIGPMMKVDSQGKEIFDPQGKLPGNLVMRPPQEYPKVVRRVRSTDGAIIEKIVSSKSEELKLIAEAPDLEEARSPLERERDDLARTVAEQDKALSNQSAMMEKMAGQMTALMASVERLSGASGAKEVQVEDTPLEESSAPGLDAEARATKGFGNLGKHSA